MAGVFDVGFGEGQWLASWECVGITRGDEFNFEFSVKFGAIVSSD